MVEVVCEFFFGGGEEEGEEEEEEEEEEEVEKKREKSLPSLTPPLARRRRPLHRRPLRLVQASRTLLVPLGCVLSDWLSQALLAADRCSDSPSR